MCEQMRKEARGKPYRREVKSAWAIVTVQGILDNDFYIGTLRQGKYTRAKINGRDVKRDDDEHIVIENHHQPIISYRTFAAARAMRQNRTTSNYRGVKKNDNVYTGFLVCGDCGSPMFSMSRRDLQPAYTCGTYHRRGRSGCTSHHIRADKLDALLKDYLRRVYRNSQSMIEELNANMEKEKDEIAESEQSADNLAAVMDDLQEELRVTKRQRIRDLMKHPEQEALLEETYDALEADLQHKITGLQHQIDLLADKRNTIIKVNRAAKTALEVFRDILDKEKLERTDLDLIIRQIRVFEDHLEVRLHSDIETLLHTENTEDIVNFEPGAENEPITVTQSSKKHRDRVFRAHVISDGDPLEIYTDRDGEVIFKKYSPMGEMAAFAHQLCETMHKTTGYPTAIADRDTLIAAAGPARRELADRHISPEVEHICESRQIFLARTGEKPVPVAETEPGGPLEKYRASIVAPVVTEGDVTGSVIFVTTEGMPEPGDTEYKLAQTIAGFLSRQMES